MTKLPLYKIISNTNIQGPYYRLVIAGFPKSEPGQFVNILCQNDDRFLLRRPFCINNVIGTETHILYKVLGPATKLLSERKTGEQIDILGPLGNGWKVEEQVNSREQSVLHHFLVGGGIGIAPLLYLASAIRHSRITIIQGGRTQEDILCVPEFQALGCEVQIATDDGSQGHKGLVTELLATICSPQSAIYACGPHAMLAAVAKISAENNCPCQVSLEAMMGCGLGGCVCCVCATKYGYEKVCSQGPVFNAEDILW